jgi:argininosuccinate lyase
MNALISELDVADNYEVKDDVYAAYTANQKVEADVPFREAYSQVKEEQDYIKHDKVKDPKSQSYEGLEGFWKEEKQELEEVKTNLL